MHLISIVHLQHPSHGNRPRSSCRRLLVLVSQNRKYKKPRQTDQQLFREQGHRRRNKEVITGSHQPQLLLICHSNIPAASAAQTPHAQVSATMEPPIEGSTRRKQANRKQVITQRLAEVNGIIVPSKIPPGHTPDKGTGKEDSRVKWACSICRRHCFKKGDVKQHMPAYVEKNGNPLGVRWSDASGRRAWWWLSLADSGG